MSTTTFLLGLLDMDSSNNLIVWKVENKNLVSKKVKYGLLFFSYVFWIIGAIFAAVGGWSLSQKTGYSQISDFATDPGAILTAIGCLVFLVSSLGVLGTVRENITYLRAYKIFLVGLLVVEVCAGIVGFAFWPEIKKVIDSNITKSIEKYTTNKELRYMIDMVQRKFECCGSLSVDDWDSNPYYNCRIIGSYRSCGVPWSCCKYTLQRNRQCGLKLRRKRHKINIEETIHTTGCLDKLFEYMRVNFAMIGGLAIAGNLPLLIIILLSQKMITRIRKLMFAYNKLSEKSDSSSGSSSGIAPLNSTNTSSEFFVGL